MLVAASGATPVGSVKALGPKTHSFQQGHGPFCHLLHGINSPRTTKSRFRWLRFDELTEKSTAVA